jgi:hypothetical protein
MYTGFATQLWSYGGSDFEGGRCAIASEASVRATSDFLAALRDAGPRDWPEQRWYELALDFARGQYGLLVDSDHYVAYYEDPAYAQVGRIAYAPPPAGNAGRRPNLWTWSVVVNARTRELDAVIAEQARAAGADFVEVIDAFEGRELRCGTAPPFVNPARAQSDLRPASFHPTAAGYVQLADVVVQHLAGEPMR